MTKFVRSMMVAAMLMAGVSMADGAKVGEAAPDFKLKDHAGAEVSLSGLKGKIVVLEWTNPDCPFVKMHYDKATTMKDTQAKLGADVVWLSINSSNYNKPEDSAKFAEAHGLKWQILQDADGTVGKSYGAMTTPHMFVIDKEGKVAYAGAIDNGPKYPETGAVNYVEAAVTSLAAGKTVEMAETKPYGCSVKYKE